MLCLCRAKAFWSPEVPGEPRRAADLSPQFGRASPAPGWREGKCLNTPAYLRTEAECYFIEGTELYSASSTLAVP